MTMAQQAVKRRAELEKDWEMDGKTAIRIMNHNKDDGITHTNHQADARTHANP